MNRRALQVWMALMNDSHTRKQTQVKAFIIGSLCLRKKFAQTGAWSSIDDLGFGEGVDRLQELMHKKQSQVQFQIMIRTNTQINGAWESVWIRSRVRMIVENYHFIDRGPPIQKWQLNMIVSNNQFQSLPWWNQKPRILNSCIYRLVDGFGSSNGINLGDTYEIVWLHTKSILRGLSMSTMDLVRLIVESDGSSTMVVKLKDEEQILLQHL